MGYLEKKEKRDFRNITRTDRFLEIAGDLLSTFVPVSEDENGTIIPPLVVPNKKGEIRIAVSGKPGKNGLWEEGRLHFVRNNKQWTIEIIASGMHNPNMQLALKAMQAASKAYQGSDLPRRKTI